MTIDLTEIIVAFIALVVAPALGVAVKYWADWAKVQIKSKEARDAIEQAEKAVQLAVAQTAQTFVDEMKAHGTFDQDAVREASQRSLKVAREILSESSVAILNDVFGDVNAFLLAKMESSVRTDKTTK